MGPTSQASRRLEERGVEEHKRLLLNTSFLWGDTERTGELGCFCDIPSSAKAALLFNTITKVGTTLIRTISRFMMYLDGDILLKR